MNNWRAVNEFVVYSTKGITPKYVDNSSIMVLNQKCVRNNNIDFSLAQYTDDSRPISNTKIIKIGDILFNSTGQGTAGRCAFVSKLPSDIKVITDSHMLLLRCNNYYEAKCLGYVLYSFEKEIQAFMDGSTGQGELDKVRLFNIQVNLTKKLPIQKKIAAVLSSLDAKIELNNRINAELEAMAKTLYDYWFVQFDFPISKEQAKAMGKPELKGKPYKSSGGKIVYDDKLKREIPEGWEVKELSDIANITMGQSPSGSSYNETEDGEIFFQGSTDFCWRFPTIRQYTTEPGRMAKQDDILLSVRAPVGTMNIADIDCCIGRGVAALNSKEGFNGYLFYVMEYFKRIFYRRNSEGTTFGSITKDDLFSLKLVYPKTDQLGEYDTVVSKYNTKIFNNHKQNQQLTQLRDWLLPMLMNGQVTVK